MVMDRRKRRRSSHGEDGGGGAQQQQGVVVSLRHVGRSDALNHELHAELVFIQDVCTERGEHSEATHTNTHLHHHPPPPTPTCSHSSSTWSQFVADVEQTAEQQLLGVLHVGVIIGARLHTPDDRRSY